MLKLQGHVPNASSSGDALERLPQSLSRDSLEQGLNRDALCEFQDPYALKKKVLTSAHITVLLFC
jgi:hypothetical protein